MDTLQHPPPDPVPAGPGAWLPTPLRRLLGWSLLLLFAVGLLGLLGGQFALWPGVRGMVAQATVQINADAGSRTGSGVLVGSQGLVLTAAHVVKGVTEGTVTVTLSPGRSWARTLPARVTRWAGEPGEPRPESMAGDWAILKVDLPAPVEGLQVSPAEPTDGSRVWVGGVVSRGDRRRPSLVVQGGTLNASLPDYRGAPLAYNTDAPIRPGMSGGPCVDTSGAVVGLCVMFSQEAAANLVLPAAQFREACRQALSIYGSGAAPPQNVN